MLNLVDSNYEDAEIESITSPENCIKLIEIQLCIEKFHSHVHHQNSDRNLSNFSFVFRSKVSKFEPAWQKVGFKTQ